MSSSLVLITGATGFIGSQVALHALKSGYRLRIVIRRADQREKLTALFGDYADKLEFAVVSDFTKADAFKDHLAGVDYIAHLASPMASGGAVDFRKDFIHPAVQGTLSLLEAAKESPSIRKVLVVSSILSLLPYGLLMGQARPPALVQENSGIKYPVDIDKEIPDGPVGFAMKYHGSKILAHQATRDWLETNKPKFTLVTIHPVFVIGPSLIQKSAADVDDINGTVYNTIKTGQRTIAPNFVDVRDVAEAMVKAFEASLPSGQEVILRGDEVSWNDIAAAVQTLYPNQDFKLKAPFEEGPSAKSETKTAEGVLGMKWKSRELMIQGLVDQQLSFA